LPFDPETLREGGYGEIQRIIREEKPPRPSTKLSSLGEKGSKVAQSRQTELSKLVKSLHKELEWIPMMAIRKERERRYQTASDFAEDIQNYLEGNPLNAGPESTIYHIKKLIKKNIAAVLVTAIFVMMILISLVIESIFYLKAEKQRKIAESEIEATRKSLYYNQIALINSEYKNGNTADVQKLLQECPQDLRNWEYEYLHHISDQARMTLIGHEGLVRCVAFTPDGSKVVSGGQDKTIRIWDVKTGKELVIIKAHDEYVSSIAISPNGRQIASASADKTVKLWDFENGNLLRIFHGHTGLVTRVAFSKDGSTIASCSRDTTFRIWDVNTGDVLFLKSFAKKPMVSTDFMQSIAFSPDKTKIATCTQTDEGIRYLATWDVTTGELLGEVNETQLSDLGVSHFWGIEFDRTGHYILTSNWCQAWMWDAESLQIKTKIPQTHQFGSRRAVFSPDGKQILTGGVFGPLKI
jgi:hypothetical protein